MKLIDTQKQVATVSSAAVINLGPAVGTFRTVAQAIASGANDPAQVKVGDTGVPFYVRNPLNGDTECSLFTITSATQLTRESVQRSTNNNQPVAFGGATVEVYSAAPSDMLTKFDQSTSTRVFYLSKCGAVSDTTATTDGTDDTVAIQAVLDITGPKTVIADGSFCAVDLLLSSNTHLIIPPGCSIKLKTGANKTLLSNRNKTFNPANKIDRDIKITGGSTNGNRGSGGANNGKGNGTTGLNCNMRWYGVDGITIENHLFYNSPSYACHFLNCTDVVVRDVRIDVGPGSVINTDGINVGGNCRRVLIENLVANTADDPISTSPDDVWAWTPGFTYPFYVGASGPISHITVRGVVLNNSETYGIRVMSGASSAEYLSYSNIKGKTNFGWAFLLDNRQVENDLTGVSGNGNILNILLDDIEVDVNGICVVRIRCSAQHVVIRALTRRVFNGAMPTILIDGSGVNLESLTIVGYNSVDAGSSFVTKHIQMVGGFVKEMRLIGARVRRGGAANGSVLLEMSGGAVIESLVSSDISLENITNLLSNVNGTITRINANNIIQVGGSATFATASVIPRLNLSGYIGDQATSGTFTTTSGDAFVAVVDTTGPNLVSAVVSNASPSVVRLTFNEALKASSVPAISALTVSGRTVATGGVAITGVYADVTLTAPFAAGASATVSYVAPGADPRFQDAAGNPVASFGPVAITNNIVAGATALTFPIGDASITNDGNNVWTTSARGYPTGGYTTYGRASTSKIPAGSNGFIYCQHPSGLVGIYASFGLSLTQSATATIACGFILYENATPLTIVTSGNPSAGPAEVVGNYYGIRRTGTTMTLETSADGVSWSVIYTWTGASTADLYPMFYLAADAGANLYHPMQIGLA